MKSLSTLASVMTIVLIATAHLSPANAQSADIELEMARLRRLLRLPSSHQPSIRVHQVPFAAIIRREALANGIDPSLLAALVRVESNFNPRAVSTAGAQGLGQLMPATGRDLGVRDPFDPHENIAASARYLRHQLRTYRSTRLALAAYNAGPGRVERGNVPVSTWRYAEQVQRIADSYRAQHIP